MRFAVIAAIVFLAGCSARSISPSPPSAPISPDAISTPSWTQVPLSSPVLDGQALGHDGDIYGTDYIDGKNGLQYFIVSVSSQGQVTDLAVQGSPGSLTPNPDTNMYAVDSLSDGSYNLVQITEGGVVTETPLPQLNSVDYPESMVTGSDGNLWLLHYNGVAKLTTKGVYTDYPGGPYEQIGSSGATVVRGPDKNLWVLAGDLPLNGMALVQVNVTDGSQTVFAAPNDARDIVQGPDKNLYCGSTFGVYTVTTQGGFTRYPTSPAPGYQIVAGPTGRLLWMSKNKIFSWNVRTHVVGMRAPIPSPGDGSIVTDLKTLWLFQPTNDQTAQVLTL